MGSFSPGVGGGALQDATKVQGQIPLGKVDQEQLLPRLLHQHALREGRGGGDVRWRGEREGGALRVENLGGIKTGWQALGLYGKT